MIAIQLINSLCTEYYQLFHFIILFIAHANCYTQQEAVVRMFVVLVWMYFEWSCCKGISQAFLRHTLVYHISYAEVQWFPETNLWELPLGTTRMSVQDMKTMEMHQSVASLKKMI
jgi:hypothetical protein